MVCTILYALMNSLSIYLFIPLLDSLFQQSAPAAKTTNSTGIKPTGHIQEIVNSVSAWFNHLIFSGNTIDSLIKICIIVILAFTLKNVFGFLQSYFFATVEQGVVKDLRNQAYRRMHELPMSYFKNERVGNLTSRFTNDVNVLLTGVSLAFFNFIREPLSILLFLAIALSISWQLTLFAALILPFSMLIIGWIGIKLRSVSARIQEKMADITTVIQETTSNVKIVKAFAMEEYENKKFGKETNALRKLILRISLVRNTAAPLTEFLSISIGAVIIYFGGRLVLIDHSLKASEFLVFIFAIFQMMPPIKELSSAHNRIQESSVAGDRIFEIIDTKSEIDEIENPKCISTLKENITYDHVSFAYSDDPSELILHDVSFSVNKGEIIAFVGPSGSGKSTLVDLLPRFFDPVSGTISIDGINIKEYSIKSLRALFAIVTQETILFNESIRHNIAYGLHDCPLEKVIEAAKTANAHDFIMELPDGYNTIIGERGLKISGGQRQRISIARALLKNPQVMIFDEATSALDNESEILVQEAIERLMKNRTTFVIAHRLSTIRNASKIVVIEKGLVAQIGTHEELIKVESGLYKKFYEMQFRD
jgi:subfamily B ATP-binding cassette protein MsbA